MKFEDSDEFDVETIISSLCETLRRTRADRDYLESKQSSIDWEKKFPALFNPNAKPRQLPKRARDGKFLPKRRA